jgi:type IV fimbrial biogenesis protein FimT
MNSRQDGMTMIELMFTVAIVGIVVGFGFPGIQEYIRNGRMIASGNDVITAIQISRSEAIKRRSFVTLCRSADPTASTPVCSTAAGGSWADGWLVFQDDNRNAVLETGEEIIQVYNGFSDTVGMAVDTPDLADYMMFNRQGLPRTTGGVSLSGNLMLCDSRGVTLRGGTRSFARAIVITPTGRPQLVNLHAYVLSLGLSCPV